MTPELRNAEQVLGNFSPGDYFSDVRCRHAHRTRLFNIGRGHFVACDSCRTYMFLGGNLVSSWRGENEDIWQRNSDSLEGYEFLE